MAEKSGEAESGDSTGTPLPNDLVQLAKQVKAAQSVIDAVQGTGARSIVGEIDNLTEKELTLDLIEHESGGPGNKQPEFRIPPHKPSIFGSQSKSPFAGTVGSVTYRTVDGTTFRCGWSNPLLGSGKINFAITGAHRARYGVFATPSAGNTNALRRWVIFSIPGPFSLREFLQAHRVNRVLAIEDAKGNSLRGLMGL